MNSRPTEPEFASGLVKSAIKAARSIGVSGCPATNSAVSRIHTLPGPSSLQPVIRRISQDIGPPAGE